MSDKLYSIIRMDREFLDRHSLEQIKQLNNVTDVEDIDDYFDEPGSDEYDTDIYHLEQYRNYIMNTLEKHISNIKYRHWLDTTGLLIITKIIYTHQSYLLKYCYDRDTYVKLAELYLDNAYDLLKSIDYYILSNIAREIRLNITLSSIFRPIDEVKVLVLGPYFHFIPYTDEQIKHI